MNKQREDSLGNDWLHRFAALASLRPEDRRLVSTAARLATLPAGAVPFRPGLPSEAYVLVIEGRVRVRMVSESGREIVLYRVAAGETCILTTACLMAGLDYAAEAVAETPVTVALIPRPVFRDLIDRSPVFRDFVFATFGRRLSDLLLLVEEVAFKRVDLRLARYLAEHTGADHVLVRSHQELATELGTAREVISRQLKEFERRGWVGLRRGQIDIRDAGALARLANG